MFWADRVAKEIIESGKYKPYWVDDMKTPSGRIHVGSLRGVVIHDLIFKALLAQNKKAKFTYVFEDHDPMDEVSCDLDRKKWSKYLGQPLFTVPSPDGKEANFAAYYVKEFKEVFNKIGCHPEIIWVSSLYKNGKMNKDIKICLDKAEIIRNIYKKLYKKKVPSDWYPFQVVCPKCSKESTTKVTNWDGSQVTFCCLPEAVPWTKGCGFCGKVSPYSDKKTFAGKLPWKVEWAVKWKTIGVTIEGAGKDHMSDGGSHDVARLICEKVINYPTPYPISYEFFLIGGKKMSSSKGLGSSAYDVSKILPPYLLRFLMVRIQINHAINFDPKGDTIPDLFDEYDRCAEAFFEEKDPLLARIFFYSQIGKIPQKRFHLPRFRTLVSYLKQPNTDIHKEIEKDKGSVLNITERKILSERIQYAQKWLQNYASEEEIISVAPTMPQIARNLSSLQKKFLLEVIKMLEIGKYGDDLQNRLYQKSKELKISPKEAFSAIYLSILGRPSGPKAGELLKTLDVNFVIDRLKEVIR
jgi:lysyl-tRNA synthetase class 1